MTNNFNQAPYLRIQRQFPNDDINQLSRQCDQAYIDTANKVNDRIIGIYATNFYIISGKSWYFTGSSTSQQSLKRVFNFTATTAINHEITAAELSKISPESYGSYTDGTNWYGIVYATSNAIVGQLSFYITPNQIVFMDGGAPALTSGFIVLEYISTF